MQIVELIEKLQAIHNKYGNVHVFTRDEMYDQSVEVQTVEHMHIAILVMNSLQLFNQFNDLHIINSFVSFVLSVTI